MTLHAADNGSPETIAVHPGVAQSGEHEDGAGEPRQHRQQQTKRKHRGRAAVTHGDNGVNTRGAAWHQIEAYRLSRRIPESFIHTLHNDC